MVVIRKPKKKNFPSDLFGELPLMKIVFKIEHFQGSRLPKHKATAWRGLIGWEIQRLVCPFNRKPSCSSCTIREYCPFFLLFQGKTRIPGILDSPRGYIVYAPPADSIEQSDLHLTLIGNCTKFLPVFIKAIFDGRTAGLGVARNPFEIRSATEILPDGSQVAFSLNPEFHTEVRGPFPLKNWLKKSFKNGKDQALYLITPLRLRKKKKYLSEMDWQFFFSTLVRRLEALNCIFNQGSPMGKEHWEKIQNRFETCSGFDESFSWRDMSRYSSRQQRKVPMGGMVGKAVLNGVSGEMLEWFKTAALIHVGKGASMGLGKIEIL